MSRYTSSASNTSTTRPPLLWVLALAVFAVGITEFVPVGMLPQIAGDFGVSIPVGGWVISAYAAGAVVGAPVMTLLGVRIPRKQMLIGLMLLFTAGNLVAALAPGFGLLLTGRVMSAFMHGAFFGIGSVVAAAAVAPERRAGAVAFMFSGLAMANLVGVPLGTWLGDAAGWRATFAVIAVLGVLTVVALARFVPVLPGAGDVHLGDEVRALLDPEVLGALAMTLLGFGGVFAVLTYLAPLMTEVAGFAAGDMTWLLAVLGVGMVIGNWAGGKLADRALIPTVLGALAALTVALGLFAVTAHSRPGAVVTMFAVGLIGFATISPLQTFILGRASAAPTLASAINIGVFNLGNAVAAWGAGATIGAGFGYASAGWVGAAMAFSGLVVGGITVVGGSRRKDRSAERELVSV